MLGDVGEDIEISRTYDDGDASLGTFYQAAYWNAGEHELRFIELLVPAGVEGYFERLSRLLASASAPSHDDVELLADEYGLQFDFQSVPALCRQFGLKF